MTSAATNSPFTYVENDKDILTEIVFHLPGEGGGERKAKVPLYLGKNNNMEPFCRMFISFGNLCSQWGINGSGAGIAILKFFPSTSRRTSFERMECD